MKLFLFIFAIILFNSCKTQEQIQREQMMDNIAVQMVEGQKLNAEGTSKLQEIQEKIGQLQGQIEEKQHADKSAMDSELNSIKERLTMLEKAMVLQKETSDKTSAQLEEQGQFLKKVLSELENLGKSAPKKVSKKKSNNTFDEALTDYKKGKYSEAKTLFLELLNDKKTPKKNLPHIIHNLGMVAFIQKNYDDAITLFSRLYTEYPTTGFNQNGLFFLAKAFNKLNKTDAAKQTLNELIQKFPDSRKIPDAKKLLTSLK